MTNFNEYLQKKLQDEDFKKEYESLEAEFSIVQAMIDARTEKGMTQKDLAEKTGINQSDISRLENGTANPSLKTIKRLAKGLGMKVKLEFVPF